MGRRRKLSATLAIAFIVFIATVVCAAQSGNQSTAMTVNGLAVINGGPVWTTGGLNGEATGQHLTLGFDTTNSIGYMGATNNGTGFSDFRLRGNLISFWTGTTELAERLTMNAEGNLGVGTSTPLEKLHLNFGNFRIDGTPGTHGIIFPDGTKQFTAAISGVSITSPDNSILVGGTSIAPTLALNTSFTDARYASLADVALLTAQIGTLNNQITSLNSQIAVLNGIVSDLEGAVFTPGSTVRANRYGSSSSEYVQATAVDLNGGYAITGYFSGTSDLGCGPMVATGAGPEGFVARYSRTGACLWAKHFGTTVGSSGAQGNGVAVDANGNTVIVGSFYQSVSLGTVQLTSAGGSDAFIAKFSPDGNTLWASRFGAASSDSFQKLALDSRGNIVVNGYYYGSVNFGGGMLTSAGESDVIVAKFSSDGSYLWAKSFGGTNLDIGFAVAVDSMDDVVLTLISNGGTFSIGQTQLTSVGPNDAFVAKLAGSNGAPLWARNHHCSSFLAIGTNNDIFVTGHFGGTVDFGGTQLTSAGNHDALLGKLAGADGSVLWAKRFGGSAYDSGSGIGVDADGNVILSGAFYSTIDFGAGSMSTQGDYDVFVAKFDANGYPLWSKRFGSTGSDFGGPVAILPNGNALVTGSFENSVQFGTTVLTSAGGPDLFTLTLRK